MNDLQPQGYTPAVANAATGTGVIPASMFLPANIDKAIQYCEFVARGTIMPKEFRNPADLIVLMEIAASRRSTLIDVCNNVYVIHGRIAWKASYLIGAANRSGVFAAPITYRVGGAGDSMKARASAILKATGEEVHSDVTMQTAIAEGWTKNPKYQTMPDYMLKLRAATFLVRLYCPQVLLGLSVEGEIEDMGPAPFVEGTVINTGRAGVEDALGMADESAE